MVEYSVAELLLALFVLYPVTTKPVFEALKTEFAKPEDIPYLGVVSKGVFQALYSGGLCDLPALDLRTKGAFHDGVAALTRHVTDGQLLLSKGEVPRLQDAQVLAKDSPRTSVKDGQGGAEGKPDDQAQAYLNELVREKNKQKLLIALDKARSKLESGQQSPEEAVITISSSVPAYDSLTRKSWGDHVQAALGSLRTSLQAGPHLKTGIKSLDGMFAFRRNNLVVVGAGTSHGKTAFLIRSVTIPAIKAGMKVAFLCFEDYHVFPLKFAAALYDVPLQYLTRYDIATLEQRRQAENALVQSQKLSKQLVVVPDTEMHNFDAIVKREKPDVILFDYLQKYVETYGSDEGKRELCGRVTSQFQNIARRDGCYAVMASQIRRREVAKIRKEDNVGVLRRPGLGDLKESGDIENYADAALILWWPWRDCMESESSSMDKGKYHIQVAKDKLGPGGDIECRFEGETLMFRDKYDLSGVN